MFIGNSKGGVLVKANDLPFIGTPDRTATWHPVSHHGMVTLLKAKIASVGLEILNEGYSVAKEGLDLFGVFDFAGTPDIGIAAGFSMGFRHSNAKRFAIQMVAGARVFVCSNLCFSGEMITLKRKHTSGLNLRAEINMAVDRYLSKSAQLEESIIVMQQTEVSEDGVKSFLLDSVVQGVMPQALLIPSYSNYFEPQAEDCAPRNAWGVHNAVTRAIRDSNLVDTSKFDATVKIGSAIRALTRKA